MATIFVLSVHDGVDSSTSVHATRDDAEAALRLNFDQEPADYAHLAGDDLLFALEERDDLEIAISEVELELPAAEPGTIPVWFTAEELGLLRAGLAAHAISLRHTDPRQPGLVKKADAQRAACRELSLKLGDAQIELDR